MLFELANQSKDLNWDAPISEKDLKNPDHPITRIILKVYSMETYLFQVLNQTCREKDKD